MSVTPNQYDHPRAGGTDVEAIRDSHQEMIDAIEEAVEVFASEADHLKAQVSDMPLSSTRIMYYGRAMTLRDTVTALCKAADIKAPWEDSK